MLGGNAGTRAGPVVDDDALAQLTAQGIAERTRDVDLAYTTTSLAEAETILRKYGVTYVFVGSVERGKYEPAGLAKFDALPVAFRAGQTAVYRLPPARPGVTGAAP